MLVNLWQIFNSAIQRGFIKDAVEVISKRTQTIKAELDRLASDERRPNNALQAQTHRLFVDLTEAFAEKNPIDPILEKFIIVLKKSEGLSEYPVTSTVKIIQELGEILTDSPKYDELLEVVIEITERRASEGQAGQILLERGMQKIRSGKNYDTIKLIGRAQQKLAKDEYKSEWITSLVICGLAYEAVGLLWAARANFLMATNEAFAEYTKNGKLNLQTLQYVKKLIWLELQLGRLPHVLSWIEFNSLLTNLMVLENDQQEKFEKEKTMQDGVLAILLMKTDFWELKWLDFLPHVLERMGLYTSWMALLYLLGYEGKLREEKVIPEEETPETIRDLFARLPDQPANKDIPEHPEFLTNSNINFVSPVLGCHVIINTTNNRTTLFLAENIIGALEAFLATSFDSDVMPYRSELHINIRISDFLTGLPEYTINEKRQGEIEIRCPLMISKGNSDERSTFRDWLVKIILDITFQIAVVADIDTFIDQIIKDERSFDRAIMFSDVEIALTNILGEHPKMQLADWTKDDVVEKYPLRRDTPWDFEIKRQEKNEAKTEPFKPATEEPPESFSDMEVGHKDIKSVSFINMPLWNEAKWQAMGFVCMENTIPILALAFKNPEAGNKIFEEWQEMLGEVDEENKLRIAIITGVSKKQPLNYKVLITTNPEKVHFAENNHYIFAARFMEMSPESPRNLNVFLRDYKKAGRFVLVPAKMNIEKNYPEPIGNFGIGKYDLVVRPAWQIGPNDPDVPAIQPGDDPIIPEGEKNAPVIRALKRFDSRKKRKRH